MSEEKNKNKKYQEDLLQDILTLTEIAGFSSSESLEDFKEEITEKAISVFNPRSFAIIFDGKLFLSWGIKENIEELLIKAKKPEATQFVYPLRTGKASDLLFIEQTQPIAEKERKLYIIFASKVAERLGQLKLLWEKEQFEKRLKLLYEATLIVSEDLNLDHTLKRIAEIASKVFGPSFCAVRILNEKKDTLELKAVKGLGNDFIKQRKFVHAGSDISGLAVKKGTPVFVNDLLNSDLISQETKELVKKYNMKSYIAVPIRYKGEILGVLSIITRESRKFSEEEITTLNTFAEYSGQAIVRAKLYQELKESEEKYRTMIETANDLIWMLDKNGRFTYANKKAEELSGYKLSELIGKDFAPLIVPEDLPEVEKIFKETLKGSPQTYRVRVYKKDRGIFVLSVNTAPIFKGEKIIGTVSFGRDITRVEETKEKILSLYNLFQDMAMAKTEDEIVNKALDTVKNILKLENAMYFSIDKQKSSLYLKADRAGEEKIKLPLDSEKGITVWVAKSGRAIIVPDTRKEPRYIWRTKRRLSEIAVPVKIKGKVVGVVNAESERVNAFLKEDLELLQILASGLGTAIENLRLINKLRESQAKYKSLFEFHKKILEVAPVGIVNLDENFRVIYENPEAKRITGVPEGEESKIIGMDIREISSLKKARLDSKIHRLLEGKRISEIIPFESTYGKKFFMAFKANPLFDKRGFKGAILTIKDVTEQIKMKEKLEESYRKLKNMLFKTVEALSKAMEVRDPYTAGHQRRVAQLACAIADEMGLSVEMIEAIRVAALLHDMGKLSIPAEILTKPTKLSEIEFEIMKAHSEIGYKILKQVNFPGQVAEIVLQHHERQDGSGYPQGLKGNEILLEARILAVADVVEAMSSHRPYRPALGIGKALEEISRNKGIKYDADVVDACLRVFEKGFEFEIYQEG